MEIICLNKTVGDISRKIAVRALGAQTRNVDFIETALSGWMDFIVIKYSVPNNPDFFQGQSSQCQCYIKEYMQFLCNGV
jgi:hypothetical protein